LVDRSKVELSRSETKRIENEQAVVRYDAQSMVATLFLALPHDQKHYLYIKVNKIGERQMKALPIFILDYLIYYPGQEKEYLEKSIPIFHIQLKLVRFWIWDSTLNRLDDYVRIRAFCYIVIVPRFVERRSRLSRQCRITLLKCW
jgi:hypothetical protein